MGDAQDALVDVTVLTERMYLPVAIALATS
jgi:hypothetical protein